MKAIIYCGWKRETEVEYDIEDNGCGCAEIICLECNGTGNWARFHPEPYLFPDGLQCVQCKGTGTQLVSV